MRKMFKSRSKGFTLVELLAVVVILGIVVGITIVAIMSTLNSAREKALATAAEVSADWIKRQYHLWSIFPNDPGVVDTIKPYFENYNGTFVELDGTRDAKLIESAGLKASNVSVLVFSIDSGSKNVCVALTGRGDYPTMTKYGGSGECEFEETEAEFDTGKNVNVKIKTLAGVDVGTDGYQTVDTKVNSIVHSSTAPSEDNMKEENNVSVSNLPIYMWYDNNTIYWWSRDAKPSLNSNSAYMFYNFKSLSNISGLADFDLKKTKNMAYMFYDSVYFTDVNSLRNWNTSNVTNMAGLFMMAKKKDSSNLSDISGLEKWNVSNVTNMSGMFSQCYKISDISALAGWDTSSVTNMSIMFQNVLMTSLEPLRGWDVSKVKYMQWMFNGARAKQFTTLEPLSNWNVGNVTNMKAMFFNASKLTDLHGLENWNVSNVEDMGGMFVGCSGLKNLNALSNWNVTKVTNFGFPSGDTTNHEVGTFSQCSSLEDASGINSWNINKDANFTNMFWHTPVHATFTKYTGTWDSEGTFTPN